MKIDLTLNANGGAVGRYPSKDTGCSLAAAEPQLELAFATGPISRGPGRRRPGQSGAAWWFQRMRQLVDCAHNWQPAPPPSRRQRPLLGAALTQTPFIARQICE